MRLFYILMSVLLVSCKTDTSTNKIFKNTTPLDIVKDSITGYFFNTEILLEDVKNLSSDTFEGRRTGTKGAALAKNYVIDHFTSLGVKPLNNTFEQSFSFSDKKIYNAVNILGVINGREKTDKYIVISAHYDHEGIKNGKIYNGADDDASGVSALFAFAEYFAKNPPKHNVIFAAFDAEELGLKGAYHFVENNILTKRRNIVLNLNMDMISRSEKQQLFAVGTSHYPILKPTIANFKDIGVVDLLIDHEGLTKADDWSFASDHAAFHKAKIPFVYFGVADHEDYHEPTDDFENIDQQFYKDAVQTIISIFTQFDNLDL